MSVDPASLFERDSYGLMISAFVPRVRRQPGYGGNRREMNQASGDYAASVSEFDEAGLTRAPAVAVQGLESGGRPRISNAASFWPSGSRTTSCSSGGWFDFIFVMTCSPE